MSRMRVLIALPVLNEEKVLRASVEAVRVFAAGKLPGHDVEIVIADNGSTDATEAIGRALARENPGVRYLRVSARGKGLAVREAWGSADADIYVFMDADLATDLAALPELLRRMEAGAGLAVGSRFHPGSVVERSALRKVLSRGYRAFLRVALGTSVEDVPCGFKAASTRLVREVVPKIKDNRWFFDTELVVRAERAGHRIEEVPVVWKDVRPSGRESKVRIVPLIREYVSEVLRLRRELGPAPLRDAAGASPSALIASITRREWAWAAGAALLAAIVTSVPPIAGALIARSRGLEWNGRQFLSPGDFGVYLSYIAQAKSGRVLFENLNTSERLTPVLNVLWLSVGLMARLFSLTPLVAYHVARVALIFPFAATAYASIAYFFRDKSHRLGAFFLFLFGSGLGLYAAPFLPAAVPAGGAYEWPIDFWVSEANAFLTMMYSPHFVASFGLILASLTLLLMAYDAGRIRYGAWAGAVALVLFEFHPFHVPTLYAIGGAALAARTLAGGYRPRQWGAYLAFLAVSSPSVAYQYWLTHWSPDAAFMLDNNITITPSLPHLILGFGAVSLLSFAGWRASAAGRSLSPEHRRFLAAWAVVQLVLVYLPFSFRRRLLEGMEFPLVLLSIPALVALHRSLLRRPGLGRSVIATYGVLLSVAVFLPSSVSAVVRGIDSYASDRPPIFFFSPDQSAALAWLRDNAPQDAVILSEAGEGNVISGWAARTVYAGHWANTIALERKQGEIARFFGGWSSDERRAFAASHGISFVYETPSARALGGSLAADPSFEAAFRAGGIVIYRLR
ncbi:MAG: hypothetical protein RL272_331 [Candidatus Parcubacteria bacterium]